MAPYASRLPVPADARAAHAARALRGRRAVAAPRCCTTGCCRLARHFGASPPLNMWVRTAPRGADHFCWRIDVLPRLTHLAGLELSTEREPEHRRARARRGGAARRVRTLGSPGALAGGLGCQKPCPPRSASYPASPPSRRRRSCHTAAGRSGCARSSWRPREARRRAGRPRRAGEIVWYPGSHAGTGARTCPRPRSRPAATSCSATSASCRATSRRRAERLHRARRLHRGDRRAQPGLAAGPVRRGDRRLARRTAARSRR